NSLNLIVDEQDQMSTVLYAVMKETHQIKKLDIDNDEIGTIQTMFLQSIRDKIINVEDQNLIAVSIADDRANTLFEYDLDLPEGLNFYAINPNDQTPLFSFQNDDLGQIDSLIIKIGNEQHQIRLFKK